MAKKDLLAQRLEQILPKDAVCADAEYRAGVALAAQVPANKLRDAITAGEEVGYFLESIAGLDFTDTLEVVYHLNCYEPRSRVALRVLCPPGDAPPSVSDILPGALWLEREVHDFFGIKFQGCPDLRPLLLPEDADYHPHLKTFKTAHAYRKREEIYG
jgi:NADH-quinone oxidoreductase subunit C